MTTTESKSNEMNQIDDGAYKLVDDLGRVLEGDRFQFPGGPFHIATHTTWTNPCLNIAGLGFIGLPLSDRDAAAIKASEWASHNGDIWSINASHISFENPEWDKAVLSFTTDMYETLGINLCTNPPEYRFDRLLLFGPGLGYQTIAVPYQNEETVAHLFIILPSSFNGGEIQLSSSIRTETFDISSYTVATCVLGWYNDVLCNAQPITTGHSLVLSYRIIKTTSVMPKFPDMTSGIEALRSIFQKWRRLEYRQLPAFRYIFYRLSHEYPVEEIGRRNTTRTLVREDAHKLHCLQSATNGTGYRIYLGRVQKQSSSFDDTSESDTIIMDLFNTTTGDELASGMKIQEDSVIPSEVVDIFASGHKDVTGGIRYGVLVFHEDNEGIALLGLQRLPDILRHLRESLASSNMTEREMMMARYIALNLGHTPGNEDVGRLLADYALKYENVDLWLDAFKIEQRRLTHENMNNFLKATQLFGFHQVEESLQNTLDSTHNLPNKKVDLLCELHDYACQNYIAGESDALIAWCKDNINSFMTGQLLHVFDNFDVLIQTLRNVLRVFGMEYLETIELGTIELIPQFVKFLGEHTHAALPPDDAKVTDHLLNLSIDVVVRDLTRANYDLWHKVYSDKTEYVTGYPASYQTAIGAAFLWAIGACILCERTDRYEDLFSAALNPRGSAYTKVVRFYMPVMHELRSMMDVRTEPIATSRFAGFARAIIWEYLRAMLGTRSINPRVPPRRIGLCSGCQCNFCVQLDAFMTQPHTRVLRFHMRRGKTKKGHIESVTEQGKDLVSVMFRSYYGVEITKLPHVLASARWEGRVAEASEFLKVIGTKEEIRVIMGSDYNELQKAMRGEDTAKLPRWSVQEIEQRNLDLRRYEEELVEIVVRERATEAALDD